MATILHLPADVLARLAYKYDVEGFPDGVLPNTEHAEVCMHCLLYTSPSPRD